MALAQQIAERDPYALKLAKASVNETQDAQGWRQAMESAFKNYMLTIPHRIEMGTYGPEAREKSAEGPLRRPQQEERAELSASASTTAAGAAPRGPSATLKVSVVTRRMPS